MKKRKKGKPFELTHWVQKWESAAWWTDSHVVERQSCGGEAVTWWTGSHVVEQEGFRERVRKRNVLKRDMPKFKPASEKKKEIVTPI